MPCLVWVFLLSGCAVSSFLPRLLVRICLICISFNRCVCLCLCLSLLHVSIFCEACLFLPFIHNSTFILSSLRPYSSHLQIPFMQFILHVFSFHFIPKSISLYSLIDYSISPLLRSVSFPSPFTHYFRNSCSLPKSIYFF